MTSSAERMPASSPDRQGLDEGMSVPLHLTVDERLQNPAYAAEFPSILDQEIYEGLVREDISVGIHVTDVPYSSLVELNRDLVYRGLIPGDLSGAYQYPDQKRGTDILVPQESVSADENGNHLVPRLTSDVNGGQTLSLQPSPSDGIPQGSRVLVYALPFGMF